MSDARIDVQGACWPSGPGTTAAEIAVGSPLLFRGALTRHVVAAARGAEAGASTRITSLARYLEALSPDVYARIFRHPAFFLVRRPELFAPEQSRRRAEALLRFAVGVDTGHEVRWQISPHLLEDRGLYLPHLHARLRSPRGRPVEIHQRRGAVAITWLEEGEVTLPLGRLVTSLGGVGSDRFELLPRFGPWPILNRTADAETPGFDLADRDLPGPAELRHLELGYRLLERVWPEAAADVRHYFTGLLHMPPDGACTFSTTMASFLGSFNASWINPVQVADAMVHEVAHTRLAPFFDVDGLLEGEDPAIHPSPWRRDPRPLRGLLNGVHAFLNVSAFYRRLDRFDPELVRATYPGAFDRHRTGILEAWPYLRDRARTTALGRQLFDELDRGVRDLADGTGAFAA